MKVKMRLLVAWLVLIFIAGLSSQAYSQLTVVSTFPANGATSVDTTVTLEIAFNAPLDTTVRFAYPPQFFLNLAIQPDSLTGPPDSITLSPDLKTVYVHDLHLWPDTKYLFIITNAVSLTNDSLVVPFLATFSTGSSLSTSSVSGNVSFPGENVAGIAVALLNAPLFSEEESGTEGGAIVQTVTGEYRIDYITPGTYWPVAIKDYYIDQDGELQPFLRSGIGFYDPDSDGMPDSVVVGAGQQLSGINISLFSLAPITARFNYPAVALAAKGWIDDAVLVMLGTEEISPDGKAMAWMYGFYSESLAAFRAWATTGTLVIAIEKPDLPQSTTMLPLDWLDSDMVADSAEARGGSDFRAQYADAEIMAFMGYLSPSGLKFSTRESANLTPAPATRHSETKWLLSSILQPTVKTDISSQTIAGLQGEKAVWGINYFSLAAGQQLFLMFDAVTGEFIPPWTPSPTTARMNLDAANQVAEAWAADAALVLIMTRNLPVPDDKATVWSFIYYSAGKDSTWGFNMAGGICPGGGEPFLHSIPSKTPMPSDWIDSPVAVATAEAYGGSAYRSVNQNVLANANLSYGLYGADISRTVWAFEYFSTSAPSLNFYIDALTGGILTDVDIKSVIETPKNYALKQNYPNPFNPETIIEFQWPTVSTVELTIFNLQGRTIATWMGGNRSAGRYNFIWHGMDNAGQPVGSGVYLYRFKANNFVETKKMLLLR